MRDRGIQQRSARWRESSTRTTSQPCRRVRRNTGRFASSSNPDYDLVSCIGYAQRSALSETAPSFSDQQFMIVDDVVDEDNVASYLFREEQGSFQVGYLAGLLTTRDVDLGAGSTNPDETTVGFVGGLDQPLIHKFEAGFRAGVEYANTDVDVLTEYLGNFDDVQGARDIAASSTTPARTSSTTRRVARVRASSRPHRLMAGTRSGWTRTSPGVPSVRGCRTRERSASERCGLARRRRRRGQPPRW